MNSRNHQAPMTLIEGALLARRTTDYAKALTELEKCQSPLRTWPVYAMLMFGSGLGYLTAHLDFVTLRTVWNVCAGVAFFFGLSAVSECSRIGRKVDALITVFQYQAELQDRSVETSKAHQ